MTTNSSDQIIIDAVHNSDWCKLNKFVDDVDSLPPLLSDPSSSLSCIIPTSCSLNDRLARWLRSIDCLLLFVWWVMKAFFLSDEWSCQLCFGYSLFFFLPSSEQWSFFLLITCLILIMFLISWRSLVLAIQSAHTDIRSSLTQPTFDAAKSAPEFGWNYSLETPPWRP